MYKDLWIYFGFPFLSALYAGHSFTDAPTPRARSYTLLQPYGLTPPTGFIVKPTLCYIHSDIGSSGVVDLAVESHLAEG